MTNNELMEAILLVKSAIGTFTGPTGGWLASPEAVMEEIGVALRERYYTPGDPNEREQSRH